MKSLFESEGHNEILKRIDQLNASSEAVWGTMNVSQMLKHCQFPMEVASGKKELSSKKLSFMKRLIFKLFKPSMYNDKPWKQGLQTAKKYVVKEDADFDVEKEKLVATINEFSQLSDKTNWPPHPFFGNFTTEQWGKAQYKHLDHHLRQFGV